MFHIPQNLFLLSRDDPSFNKETKIFKSTHKTTALLKGRDTSELRGAAGKIVQAMNDWFHANVLYLKCLKTNSK